MWTFSKNHPAAINNCLSLWWRSWTKSNLIIKCDMNVQMMKPSSEYWLKVLNYRLCGWVWRSPARDCWTALMNSWRPTEAERKPVENHSFLQTHRNTHQNHTDAQRYSSNHWGQFRDATIPYFQNRCDPEDSEYLPIRSDSIPAQFALNQCRISIPLCGDLIITLLSVKQCFNVK